MATLNNISNDTFITLNLKTISESPAWISYDLNVSIKQNGYLSDFFKLSSSTNLILYFENECAPEVLMICDSLDSLIKNEISLYVFEPMDEKDFYLEINRIKHTSKDYFKIQLFMDYPKIRSRPGIQMYSTTKDLIDFTNQLRKEYEELMSQFK